MKKGFLPGLAAVQPQLHYPNKWLTKTINGLQIEAKGSGLSSQTTLGYYVTSELGHSLKR